LEPNLFLRKDGKPRLKCDGTEFSQLENFKLIKELAAQRIRRIANIPEPGDLVNESNYELRNIAYYMKKYKKFDKEKKKYCKYEYTKIKEDQIRFTKKVYGIFASMMILTFIPVLVETFDWY